MLKHEVARRNPLSLKPICIYPIVNKLASFRRMRVFALRLPRAERGSPLSTPSRTEPSPTEPSVALAERDAVTSYSRQTQPRRAQVANAAQSCRCRKTALPAPYVKDLRYRLSIARFRAVSSKIIVFRYSGRLALSLVRYGAKHDVCLQGWPVGSQFESTLSTPLADSHAECRLVGTGYAELAPVVSPWHTPSRKREHA